MSMESLMESASDLTLEEERGSGTILRREAVVVPQVQRWSLLGRFLTERSIRVDTMQNVMADLWEPRRGLCVEAIGPNLFRFDFFNQWERERAIKGGPYTFENQLLLVQKLEGDRVRGDEVFTKGDFWMYVYDLPSGFMSEHVAVTIGSYVGEFIEADANNFTGTYRTYMKIRVRMDVTRPLKRKMLLGVDEENMFWVNFKYERLPTFCFHCGLIGHADKFCERLLDHPDPEKAIRPYSPALRAPTRRQMARPQSRWLLPKQPTVAARREPVDTPTPLSSEAMTSGGVLLKKKFVLEVVRGLEGQSGGSSGTKPVKEGVVIPEVKRRRQDMVDDGCGDKTAPLQHMECDVSINDGVASKNGENAGSGVQTRQEL
ncbi:nucleic acid binding zinc ion binding [Euphorbia peplus]|nr:nucleic acid binding zinc ion binding [Euphorbia peplus]